MGHYDDQRRAEDERDRAMRDRDFLVEICRGDFDTCLAAAHAAKVPVMLAPAIFERMLRLLKSTGMADAAIAEIADEHKRQRQISLIDRLQRERLQRDQGR